jgi:hypothetical protein
MINNALALIQLRRLLFFMFADRGRGVRNAAALTSLRRVRRPYSHVRPPPHQNSARMLTRVRGVFLRWRRDALLSFFPGATRRRRRVQIKRRDSALHDEHDCASFLGVRSPQLITSATN